MKKIALLFSVIAAFALAGCDMFNKELPTKLEQADEPTKYWSEVSADYGLTSQGNIQSPIDINAPITADMPPLEVDYGSLELHVMNNGYMFKQIVPNKKQKENVLTIDGKDYYLMLWHWHVPGEHKVDGKKAPMELHLVHRSSDDKYAVVGVMYEYGDSNQAVQTLFDAAANLDSSEVFTIDVRKLLPQDLSYYYYQGSLTTPPYTEGYKWFVLQNPQYMSKAEMKKYKKSGLKPNARAVQNIEDRRVKKVAAE